MILQELIDTEYNGWYVESADDNVITLKSDSLIFMIPAA